MKKLSDHEKFIVIILAIFILFASSSHLHGIPPDELTDHNAEGSSFSILVMPHK
jgi:hypothetical protein